MNFQCVCNRKHEGVAVAILAQTVWAQAIWAQALGGEALSPPLATGGSTRGPPCERRLNWQARMARRPC